jgi:hypothetical protein
VVIFNFICSVRRFLYFGKRLQTILFLEKFKNRFEVYPISKMGSSTKKHKNREPEKERKKHKRSPDRHRKDEERRKSHKEKKHKKKRDYESDSECGLTYNP